MTAWFRAYSETLNDPKVQLLPLESFKAWHNALYLASYISSKDGSIGTLDDVSFAFRETKEAVSSAFHPLLEAGLIVTVDETFHIASWKKRQYKSDISTDRVRAHRKRSRNATETPPETETETDITLSKDKGASADPDKVFWSSAKKFLEGAGVKSPGGLIGKWCRDFGQPETAKAITAAQVERAVDPVPYIERVLRGKAKTVGHRGVGI